ncbi:MAG TPA: DUF4230 domain-containing protein [Chloroflexia bacterium]|nr:DUF4230 domain-containing protein [Chloroflexia bacterium]
MGEEHVQRRKRVSDGGLEQRDSDPGSVRILPENKPTPAPPAESGGEWVIEFGGKAAPDDPTTRLPANEDPSRPPLRPGTLYTPAAAPAQPPQPSPPALPPYATYNQAPLVSPAIEAPSPNRSLMERPPERDERTRDDRQAVTVIKQGPSACSIFAATFGVIAIACSLLAFATIRDGFSGLGSLFGWVPNLFAPSKQSIDISRPSIIEKVSALSRLETVRYEIEKVVPGTSSGPLFDFLTGDKILLIAHGDVIAGVDLSKLKPEDIKFMTETNSVTIKLPKAEVFNLKNILNNEKTTVYERNSGIIRFVPDPNLETRIRQVAEEQILQAAIENGILTQAEKNAQDVIRSLVTGLGYEEVKFESGP